MRPLALVLVTSLIGCAQRIVASPDVAVFDAATDEPTVDAGADVLKDVPPDDPAPTRCGEATQPCCGGVACAPGLRCLANRCD